jgi:RNA polymerase sigma-70 factor (ECF subfamily)
MNADEGDREERTWLANVSQGDKLALKRLYLRHAPALERLATLWTGSETDAGDVVQETFLSVWRNAGRYEARSSVKTWIFSIARNKAADRRRKIGREEPLEFTEDVLDVQVPDPAAIAESTNNAEKVRACVEGLSPAMRRAVELAFFEDLGYKEIAEIENVPEGTIKTRIFHAKQKLLRCLGAFIGT